ncbi:unnamed protein product, partial [Iphiclides podalirius]
MQHSKKCASPAINGHKEDQRRSRDEIAIRIGLSPVTLRPKRSEAPRTRRALNGTQRWGARAPFGEARRRSESWRSAPRHRLNG